MAFYWVRDKVRQNHFHIFWEDIKKNMADYFTKHHPICNHRKMRPAVLKTTQKDISNDKDQRTGTGKERAGTSNTGLTWKQYNPL